MLAGSHDGSSPEALSLTAHGITADLIAAMVEAGHVAISSGHVRAGGKVVAVRRMTITAAGRLRSACSAVTRYGNALLHESGTVHMSQCQQPKFTCTNCGAVIACGAVYWDLTWGSGRRTQGRCDTCGGPGRVRVYHCSKACYFRQRRADLRSRRMRTIDCPSCGGRFESTRPDARYCSDACRQFAYRQRTIPA
jgi:hypothetical protein